MSPRKDKKLKDAHRWLIAAIIFVFILFTGGAIAFVYAYDQRIYPGVYVGPVAVGGLTRDAARKKFNDATDAYLKKGFAFKTAERRAVISAVIIAPEDPDLYYELVSFDVEKMVEEAYIAGRKSGSAGNLRSTISALAFKNIIPLDFSMDKERLLGALEQNFAYLEEKPEEAGWKITFASVGEPRFSVVEEKPGVIFRYDEALRSLEQNASLLEEKEIEIRKEDAKPEITKEDVSAAIPEARQILARAPIRVTVGEKSWQITGEAAAKWLAVSKEKDAPKAGLAKDAIEESLKEWGRDYGLEQEPKNAKFSLKDGKVSEFQTSENGLHIASDKNIDAIRNALLKDGSAEPLALSLEIVEPEFTTGEVNTFGIKELIGTSTTSFAGSPKNRRHNIKVALEKLNGLIIPAGEDFSLVKAIGNVDADAGFKEELVIKENKTTPEFGGGLCQIATTVFRSGLKSGLPVLERQNHSYRVSYYEPPAGMDATIYLPKPDLVLRNNTGAAILVQGNVSGDNLTFEFWGASDGRVAESTKPVVTNITPPPPPKLVMTDELPPGVKRCTEKAHNGADAVFTYTITYPDGKKEEQVFRSHYRPWQEVCLQGVEPGQALSSDSPPPHR